MINREGFAAATARREAVEAKRQQPGFAGAVEDHVVDEYGNVMGYCNSCGEEIGEFEDCCDDGEFVAYEEGGG